MIKKFVRDYEHPEKQETRVRFGYLQAWISIVCNLILFVFKLLLGLFANSIALIADSFHTLSDVFTSVCVLVGFAVAKKPADYGHPFGHGRSEFIATFVIAVLLVVVGFEFMMSSIQRIIDPPKVVGTWWLILIMLLSALVKEWMARFSINLGQTIKSKTLVADAWHHRSDAIATFLIAFGFLAAIFGLYRIDGILGIVISALIIYTGITLSREAISPLMGARASQELETKVIQIARQINGVKNVHAVEVHDYGQVKAISIHIEVQPNLTVTKSHDIGTEVQEKIDRELGTKTTVHIEPHAGPKKV